MAFNRGDMVLLAFPFSSGSEVKQRPGLVLLDSGDLDVLVAPQSIRSSYDVAIQDWTAAGLLAPSVVRLDKLATVERTLVRRVLGHLSDADRSAVQAVLHIKFASLEMLE